MLLDPQFLHILAAESEHLVTVTVSLPGDVKADFERRLREAFESNGYTDSAAAWNSERFRVVQDVVDKHLVPAGVKHVREWLREEVEDALAAHCADVLREVRPIGSATILSFNIPFSALTLHLIRRLRRHKRRHLRCWLSHGARASCTVTT
jgi:transcriptional accessory protein Tex/SPT6